MRQTVGLGAIIAILCFTLVRAELKVTQVQVLFRHGDRTPVIQDLYPNDIHNVSAYEPWGLGQLINIGKMREYEIGQLLKTRYRELLGSRYIPTAIHAVSTDYDRTKMSLQLVLAGLFAPSEAEMWNSELSWMPIPTHYAPKPLDITLLSYLCPQMIAKPQLYDLYEPLHNLRYDEAYAEVMRLPEVQAKIAEHNDLFEFITVVTGWNIKNPKELSPIFHTLMSQKALNLRWPDWCTDDVFRRITEATSLQYQISSYTTDTKRMFSGPLVKKFIDNMFINKTKENPRKMYLYSAHETTVAAYLQAHGIFEPKIPAYGTAVMFEKLEDDNGEVYVRLVLWTGVTKQVITLQVPGCEEICPIGTYQELTHEIIPSDEELNCHWNRLSVDELRRVFDEMISYA